MATTAYDLSQDFLWQPEYDTLLEQIARTDTVDIEWEKLRSIIKCKIANNITVFLSEPLPSQKPRPLVTTSDMYRIPPFPPRRPEDPQPNEIPVVHMNAQQADELKSFIFAQLHQFDDGPPFTIQRLCELCLHPNAHYKSLGKYLRAIEKTVLVTSTHSAFLPPKTQGQQQQYSQHPVSVPLLSAAPPTPLFSPIPFLHEDARRSKSRSPPPSPLMLTSSSSPEKALGLVDELDDPSPGHLSNSITPLTATTTATMLSSDRPGRPFIGSLEERFVKAKEEERPTGAASESGEVDSMVLDGDSDSEKEQKT